MIYSRSNSVFTFFTVFLNTTTDIEHGQAQFVRIDIYIISAKIC